MVRIGSAARVLAVTLGFLPIGDLGAQVDPAQAAKLVGPDSAMSHLPPGFPRPASAWQAAEKAFYEELLAKGRFDVLVLPFQGQYSAFDRSTRSLMTAELALAIGAQDKKVPDPYLVARALGDGYRRLDLGDVYRLARKLQVSKIVTSYAGHGAGDRMMITLQIHTLAAGSTWPQGEIQTRQLNDFPRFSDEDPPIEVFHRMLPSVVLNAGFASPVPRDATPASRFDAPDLPPSPLRLTSEHAEPARDAYAFQLLAALTPLDAERARERFAEKSLLAVLEMSPDSPDFRVLKARALMQLGQRPAALKALGAPDSDEARHLAAMLNGNLPDVQRYAVRVRPGIPALIARLELNQLASYYGYRTQKESLDEAKKLKLPGRSWPFLVSRAFTTWDEWAQYENSATKALLDRDFPIPTFTAEQMIRGAVSLGDPSRLQTAFDLSILDHARKYAEMRGGDWCCRPLTARVNESDYLDLLESVGTSNLVRRARLIVWTQALPEAGLDFLARIDGVYRDHPALTLSRATAELTLARATEGSRKTGLQRSAYEHAFAVYYWEQGQTVTAAQAWDLMVDTDRRDYGYLANPYTSDLPFRTFFPATGSGDAALMVKYLQAALMNSTGNFDPVLKLNRYLGEMMKDWPQVDELLKSIEGRFEGNPQRPLLLARNSARKGDFDAAKRYYRESIKSQPRKWEPYIWLGAMLLEDGDYTAATRLFMSYPGFKKGSKENRVNLSNDAYLAGSGLYWSGHLEQAKPLYRIAADLNTGSEASLSSAIRLDLAKGDYAAALYGSLNRAQRYNTEYAYRDYLAMLHAMGRSKEAWDAFNLLVGRITAPELWEAPLVGHRRAGASESEIADWVKGDALRRTDYAGMYLLRAGVTDRTPSPELPAAIAAVERPVWFLPDYYNRVVRESVAKSTPKVLNVDRESVLPLGVFETAKKNPLKSDLVAFAEAYRLMRNGEHAQAKKILEEALALYDPRLVEVGYLLPYYAFAAAKSGDAQAVSKHLDSFEPPHQRFDYYLARAIVAGLGGKPTDSLRDLKLALHRRPFTQGRPVYSEYQFAEICEWLYESTKDVRYRATAIRWAKSVQGFSPWFAWAYAMEARLTTNRNDRERAIAMAFYLDPKSERLAKIPKREIQAATKGFNGRNPFLRPASATKDTST